MNKSKGEQALDKFTDFALTHGGRPFGLAVGVTMAAPILMFLVQYFVSGEWEDWFAYPTYGLFLVGLLKLAWFLVPSQAATIEPSSTVVER